MKMSIAVTGALCAAAVTTAAIAAKPTTRNRAEIPAEYRWDFSAIYPSWAAWEEGMKEMDARMDAFAKLQGTLAQGPQALLKAYQSFDDIGKLQYRLYRYPQLQRDVDTRDQAVAGRFQRMSAVFAKFDTASAWFTPELLKIPEATVTAWIAQTPALAPYRFPILDAYRRKAHVLDDKGERLLSLAGQLNETPRTIYQELSTSDIKFPTVRLGDGSEVAPQPRQLRRAAREEPQPERARPGRGRAPRHLRRDREHVRLDLQRHAAARLVPRPVAQLRQHARRGARRQRDPACRRRDADRRDARRLGAVPALRAPAPEAARPAELPPLRRLPADLPAPTRLIRSSRRATSPSRRSRRSATTT